MTSHDATLPDSPVPVTPPTDGGAPPSLTLRLFGAPALLTAGGSPVLGLGKPLALVAFLSSAPGRTASRDQLVDLLWSDVDRDAARHTLRQTLWYIKRRAGTDVFTTRGDTVTLQPALANDRQRFLAALDAGRPDDALAQYTGDFFAGFAAPGGAEFEQWADVERTRLRSLFTRAAEARVRELLAAGTVREAVSAARRVRDLAPTAQALWRLVLETLLSADDRIGALVEAEQLEQWLARDELPVDQATTVSLRLVRAEQTRPEPEAVEGLTPELVGREREFAALTSAWEDTKRGLAGHVHVHARAGFGKSRLLHAFGRRLRAARHRVVRVRALQANRDIPSALAAELAVALARLRGAAGVSPEAAAALVALAPAVSAHLSAAPDRTTGDDALRRRTLAIQELVATVAEDAPLAILVDDLHWADGPSRAMLSSLAASLAAHQVLLVTAGRAPERATRDDGRFRQLALSALAVDEVTALLSSLGELPGEAWTEELAVRLTVATGGSPLLILETLHLALERGALQLSDRQWRLCDAAALAQLLAGGSAIRQRIHTVSDLQEAMLLLLAVLGTDIGSVEAQRIAGDAGVHALLELEARGLLTHHDGRWMVAHDEIAELTLEAAPEGRRRRAHREAATLLEATPGESTAHLLRAAHHRHEAGDASQAAQLLAEAARRSQASGDVRALAALARSVVGREAPQATVDELVRALPWRMRTDLGRIGVMSLAPLALLALFLWGWMSPPGAIGTGTTAPDAVASLLVRTDDGLHMLRLELDAAAVRTADVIEVREEALPATTARVLRQFTSWHQRLGDTLVVGGVHRGARAGTELEALVLATGERLPFAPSPGDDNVPSLSPDGQRAVITTARWDTVNSRSDLAVFDRRTGEVTPLVVSPEMEMMGLWSADGTRIAYTRRYYTTERPDQLCWIAIDRVAQDCLPPLDGVESPLPKAWVDADELLVEGESPDGSQRVLARVQLGSAAVRVVHRGPNNYWVSPDGRFALISVLAADGGSSATLVFETDRPQRLVPIRWAGRDVAISASLIGWTFDMRSPTQLTSVRIEAPGQAIPLDALVRLRAAAVDARGVVRTPGVLRWASLDPEVAEISPTGALLPRRPGEVRIVLSAGGWRTDTAQLRIAPPTFPTPVLEETWTSLDSTRWLDFGDPPPQVDAGSLLPNGDQHLMSGVVSWQATPPGEGIGLELRARIPVDAPQWQVLTVAFASFASTEAMRTWEGRRSGVEMMEQRGPNAARWCGFTFPRSEGGDAMRHGNLTVGENHEALKSGVARVSDGAWHTFRLQVFRDGRCGLAIDGRVIHVSRGHVPVDRPLRVTIYGQSVGTTVRVGRLSVWRGERLDVPWFAGDGL